VEDGPKTKQLATKTHQSVTAHRSRVGRHHFQFRFTSHAYPTPVYAILQVILHCNPNHMHGLGGWCLYASYGRASCAEPEMTSADTAMMSSSRLVCFCCKFFGFRAILHVSSNSPLKCLTLEDEANLTDVVYAVARCTGTCSNVAQQDGSSRSMSFEESMGDCSNHLDGNYLFWAFVHLWDSQHGTFINDR
jgi:hypothetical protein